MQQINKEQTPEDKTASTPSDVDIKEKPVATEEVNGRGGLEPTRYGDWEKNGRCIDF